MKSEFDLHARLVRQAVGLIDEACRLALGGTAPLDPRYVPLADEAFQAAVALLRSLTGPRAGLAAALSGVVESVNVWSRRSWTDHYLPLSGLFQSLSDAAEQDLADSTGPAAPSLPELDVAARTLSAHNEILEFVRQNRELVDRRFRNVVAAEVEVRQGERTADPPWHDETYRNITYRGTPRHLTVLQAEVLAALDRAKGPVTIEAIAEEMGTAILQPRMDKWFRGPNQDLIGTLIRKVGRSSWLLDPER